MYKIWHRDCKRFAQHLHTSALASLSLNSGHLPFLVIALASKFQIVALGSRHSLRFSVSVFSWFILWSLSWAEGLASSSISGMIWARTCCYYGCGKATVGVVDRHILQNAQSSSFCTLDAHDLVFLLFPTFYWQLALAETRKTRDLAIFVMTTTTTELITLPLCTCAWGRN